MMRTLVTVVTLLQLATSSPTSSASSASSEAEWISEDSGHESLPVAAKLVDGENSDLGSGDLPHKLLTHQFCG